MSFFVIILYIKAILVQGIFFDTYSISLFGYSFGILLAQFENLGELVKNTIFVA